MVGMAVHISAAIFAFKRLEYSVSVLDTFWTQKL